jgi:hypothetical protein
VGDCGRGRRVLVCHKECDCRRFFRHNTSCAGHSDRDAVKGEKERSLVGATTYAVGLLLRG